MVDSIQVSWSVLFEIKSILFGALEHIVDDLFCIVCWRNNFRFAPRPQWTRIFIDLNEYIRHPIWFIRR